MNIDAVLNEVTAGMRDGMAVAMSWTVAGRALRIARYVAQTPQDRAYNDARDWDDEARGHHHNW